MTAVVLNPEAVCSEGFLLISLSSSRQAMSMRQYLAVRHSHSPTYRFQFTADIHTDTLRCLMYAPAKWVLHKPEIYYAC